jgi:hypothetical protein
MHLLHKGKTSYILKRREYVIALLRVIDKMNLEVQQILTIENLNVPFDN